MKLFLLWALLLLPVGPAAAQEIKMSQTAPLEQVYGETVEDDALLPMNELDMDFGYALYETTVDVEEENPTLTIENVRDYAVVYADGKLQGYLKDSSKSLKTNLPIGIHKLSIYTENIGRITYGPEILDNSKGIYGSITLGKTDLEGWKMTPLEIKECDVAGITFKEGTSSIPCFRKGGVTVSNPAQETFLDVSGWGMGEVWINGQYLGAYWEENTEKTLDYAQDVTEKLVEAGVRVALDDDNQKIGYKIRAAQQVDRVPYMLVLGAKEAEAGNISVRDRKGETTTMELDAFIAKVTAEIRNRSL